MKKYKTTLSKSNNVVLRKKKIKNGYSLFLDIHDSAKRRKEYLKLYISDKGRPTEEDKETLKLAERIKSRKILEMQARAHNDETIMPKQKDFMLYVDKVIKESNFKTNTINKWETLKYHLKRFSPKGITFHDITPQWVESFKMYLLNSVQASSAQCYFATFKAALNKAHKTDIIIINPAKKVSNIKIQRPLPKYLTLDEIKIIEKIKFSKEEIKRAFFLTLTLVCKKLS